MQAITGVNLIDGTGAQPVAGATVLVNGMSIEAVGTAGQVEVPEGADVIDATGMTLLPGLIDCHDHLANFGYDLPSRWGLAEPRSLRDLRIGAVLKQTLETGYTAVRDAGGLDAGFRMAVDEGLVPGPRLLVGLGFITPTGGMADRVSPSGYRTPVPVDPSMPWGVADGPAAMRAVVRTMVKAGADVVKIATTGGASSSAGLGPKDMLMTMDELHAAVDEGHALGRRVMCHALGGTGLRAAIEAGVDSIEHGSYLDEDPQLAEEMAERGVFFVPTFSVYQFHGTRGTPHGRARAQSLREHHVKSLEVAMAAGVKVTAGTDAGGWVHGNNAQEIRCLVQAGMSPMQAIVAATGHAAECLGLESQIGTVEPGKRADLVLVDGDPLADVTILEEGRAVSLVMKDGQIVSDRRTESR